jgi:hypothetical protein
VGVNIHKAGTDDQTGRVEGNFRRRQLLANDPEDAADTPPLNQQRGDPIESGARIDDSTAVNQQVRWLMGAERAVQLGGCEASARLAGVGALAVVGLFHAQLSQLAPARARHGVVLVRPAGPVNFSLMVSRLRRNSPVVCHFGPRRRVLLRP